MNRTLPDLPDHDAMVDNILATLRTASGSDYAEGLYWYPAAHTFCEGLVSEYGVTLAQAAAVVAVLSPRVSWSKNLAYAVQACETGSAPTFHSTNAKLARILAGEDPSAVVSGVKVTAFYGNILDPHGSDAVTVDRHAVDIASGFVGDDTSRGVLARVGAYEAVADAYREVGRLTGLRPSQVQAITWVTWRRQKGL